MRGYLAETSLLFGLNAKDKLHPHVVKILKLHHKHAIRLYISSAAPIEAILVMRSRGISHENIIRALELMNAKLVEYNASTYVPVTLHTIRIAEELRSKHPILTYFDSIHIALAAENNLILITSDKEMIRVIEQEGYDYVEYKVFK